VLSDEFAHGKKVMSLLLALSTAKPFERGRVFLINVSCCSADDTSVWFFLIRVFVTRLLISSLGRVDGGVNYVELPRKCLSMSSYSDYIL